ncbi:hypothetical protein RB653_004783 [Dictyostelium firmibasis]|uniref:Succinate dehydrogenase [ubiquinone] cytochrome b small subunit n=1 Tax=Dictyostelium firmibasis TaxID=79012 RepID=A0AAN7Z0F2_9MYCE
MIRAGKILQPAIISQFTGFLPRSTLTTKNTNAYSLNSSTPVFGSMSIFSNVSYSTSNKSQLAPNQKLPDPAKAIANYKIFHYSTILVAACLPPTLFAFGTNLSLATDVALGVAIPVHFYLGMEAVINDYIYNKGLRVFSKVLVGAATIVMSAGLITLGFGNGIGSVVHALWK